MVRSLDSPRRRAWAVGLPALLVVGALLAGCGDGARVGAGSSSSGSTTSSTPALPPSHRAQGGLPALDRVPQSGQGTANAAEQRVAEGWFALVRQDDDVAAAALMADGARFVNGTIRTLPDRRARIAAAASLPCGAEPVSAADGGGGYVVLQLRLTAKRGAGPCDGAGLPVAVAVHVSGGRIDDWVRIGATAQQPDAGTPI